MLKAPLFACVSEPTLEWDEVGDLRRSVVTGCGDDDGCVDGVGVHARLVLSVY